MEKLKNTIINMGMGLAIGLILIIALAPLYEAEQAERKAIVAEAVAEKRAEARAYEAEVRAAKESEASAETVSAVKTEAIEEYWDEDIPVEVQAAAKHYGELYSISPEFLEALAYSESRYQPDASNGECVGLMQICPRWHWDRMERLGVSDEELWTVEGSMAVAADYLAELFERYGDADPAVILMAYNGDGRLESYRAGTCEMSAYAAEVLANAEALTEKHEARE
jgi:soluble lytic murein transglycosylase-like protein